ncbi:MAG: WapI family immunity protein [Fimbriimonas sp.]
MAGLDLHDGATLLTIERIGDAAGDVKAVARSHWFEVVISERLELGELVSFSQGLRELHAAMAGAYVFRSLTGWLEITFAMAKREELHVSIRLQSAPDYLNEVRLFINLAQSDLPRIADGVEELADSPKSRSDL